MNRGDNKLSVQEFEQVFNRLYTPLCLFSKQYVNDIEEAKDIVQAVFVKVFEQNPSFKDKNKTDGFFYTAVRNKSLDVIKSKYKRDFQTFPPEEFDALQVIDETMIMDTSAIIQNAINNLPKKAGDVIRLSIHDYSNQEIADELQISVSTVKGHKQNVYKKFRKLLANLGMD